MVVKHFPLYIRVIKTRSKGSHFAARHLSRAKCGSLRKSFYKYE